jgi:hypothetical protein
MADDPNSPQPETVDFIYNTVSGCGAKAMDQIKSLEARGVQAFSAATVLIGLASFSNLSSGDRAHDVFTWLLIAAIAYGVAGFASFRLLLPSKTSGLPSVADLWKLRAYPLEEVKGSLIQTLINEAEPNNDKAIKSSRLWATIEIGAVIAEGVAVGVAVLISRWPS